MSSSAKGYSRVLTISDLHCPWEHPDAFAFLKALKKKIKPDFVLNLGDEADAHALSFHDTDSDLMSAGDELIATKKKLHKLEKIFPKMTLLLSLIHI